MTIEIKELDKIAESVRDTTQQFAVMLHEHFGNSLLGLTAYGIVMTPGFDKSQHLVRTVAVLERIDLGALRDLSQPGAKFGRRGIAAPIIMSPSYIEDSRDVFPLEFLEISRRHATLWGQDFFGEIQIEAQDVRLQCEREIRTLLIGLRQGVLSLGGSEKRISKLEAAAAESLLRTLLGLLWCQGNGDVELETPLVAAAETLVDRNLPGIGAVLDVKADHGWPQLVALYEDLEALRDFANDWSCSDSDD